MSVHAPHWPFVQGACVGGLIVAAFACSSSAPKFTAAQEGEIVVTGVGIAECQRVGRASNSYAAYRSCMCAKSLRTAADDCADAGMGPKDAGGDHGNQ